MSTALAPLYVIEEELAALLECVETCPPELEVELQGKIAAYLGQEAAKTDHCSHVLAALEYAQKNRKDEIARLQEEIKAAAKEQEKFERYLCRVIQASGKKSLAGRTSTLSVRPSDAVEITDAGSVPARFTNATATMPYETWRNLGPEFQKLCIVATFAHDKAAIKKALKAGETVAGCDLEYRSNLQRK